MARQKNIVRQTKMESNHSNRDWTKTATIFLRCKGRKPGEVSCCWLVFSRGIQFSEMITPLATQPNQRESFTWNYFPFPVIPCLHLLFPSFISLPESPQMSSSSWTGREDVKGGINVDAAGHLHFSLVFLHQWNFRLNHCLSLCRVKCSFHSCHSVSQWNTDNVNRCLDSHDVSINIRETVALWSLLVLFILSWKSFSLKRGHPVLEILWRREV